MKKHKSSLVTRIFAAVLALFMIFSVQVFCHAEDSKTALSVIYVSPDGNDEGDGSVSAPFATLKKAFSMIDGDLGATIVLMGDVERENAKAWNDGYGKFKSHDALITITGKDPETKKAYPNAKLRYGAIVMKGPFKIEELTLVPSGEWTWIDTIGFDFVVGKNVSNEGQNVYVHDGMNSCITPKTIAVENTNTVVNGGNISNFYVGGGYSTSKKYGVDGNCTLTVNGGTISTLYVGFDSYESKHTSAYIKGDVVINFNGGTIGKISPRLLNDDSIGGAYVLIANNGKSVPSHTPPTAGKGVYIITAQSGGSVYYTGTPGVFGYETEKNYFCYVDGEKVTGDTFAVEPGTYEVTFIREKGEDFMGAYINGFPDNTFRPDEKLTRAQAAQMVVKAAGQENHKDDSFVSSFADVKNTDWYFSSVTYLEKKDLLPREWQNELLPNEFITRGEYLYIIDGLLMKVADSMKLTSFSDVTPESTPYYDAITSAVASGCVTGYEDGTFRPEGLLTRAEAVTFVNRYLSRLPDEDLAPKFFDMSGHWAQGQVLAASTDIKQNNWKYGTETDETQFTIPESAKDAKDYITALYEESDNLSGKAIRKASDEIAERMKEDILNTPNTLEIYGDRVTGTAYHISEKGSDADGDGTIEKPFRSIAGISANVVLKSGDAVLFERGGVYRGSFNVSAGVVYGSYGQGNKPLILQSKKNYADPSLWQETEWENVWVCTDELINVGVIGFDHDMQDYSQDSYNELYGLPMNVGLFGFKDVSQLCGDLQFYSELNGGTKNYGKLYLYSKDGNPGKRFKSIEVGENINIVSGSARDVVLDNLSFKFTGAHGMGSAGGAKNRIVTNCVWSWLGGSILSLNFRGPGIPVNYGNAVEIYGGCSGYYVENNWMYQIYDTAVTHQRGGSAGDCIQENIRYSKNLMEYVFWGIEYYNCAPSASQLGGKADTYTRVTRNVHSEYNNLRLGGFGWGSIVRHRGCQLYWGMEVSDTENCYARYNIFDRAYGNLLGVPGNSTEIEDKNIYIQYIGQPLGNLKKAGYVNCDYDAARHIAQDFGDKNAVVILIDPLLEPIERRIPEGLAAPDALG